MKKKKPLKKIWVEWSKRWGGWTIRNGRIRNDYVFGTKRQAINAARFDAEVLQPASLIIRKKNGQIQEERTYPRSRDPKRSPG